MIAYQYCGRCRHEWYFKRPFCPNCGTNEGLAERESAGAGTVHAMTTVHRAPTEELRPLAPYTAVLVDLDEGFRVMGHGDPTLTIGARVRAESRRFASTTIHYFVGEGAA